MILQRLVLSTADPLRKMPIWRSSCQFKEFPKECLCDDQLWGNYKEPSLVCGFYHCLHSWPTGRVWFLLRGLSDASTQTLAFCPPTAAPSPHSFDIAEVMRQSMLRVLQLEMRPAFLGLARKNIYHDETA